MGMGIGLAIEWSRRRCMGHRIRGCWGMEGHNGGYKDRFGRETENWPTG